MWLKLYFYTCIIVYSVVTVHSTYVRQNVLNSPYFKTLVESESKYAFERQFRAFENQSNNERQEREPTVMERVLQDMDTTVNPCDDFYSFACGGYIKKGGRPNGAESSFGRPRGRITNAVKTVLQMEISKTDSLSLRKGKSLFRSCMEEQSIENRGINPALQFLNDRGGWPVLGNWNNKNFDYVEMLAETRPLLKDYEFHYLPSGAIIGTFIQWDFRNKGKYAIYIDQPSFGQFGFGFPNQEVYRLGRSSIYNKAYEDYLVDLAVLFGANVHTARKDMCDVVKFETELAKITLFEEERRLVEDRYNKVSIYELSMRYPKFDWLRYLQKILKFANIKIDLSTTVVLWASPYYDKLFQILKRTSDRTLANYILLRAIQPLLPSLSKSVRYLNLRYTAIVNGQYEPRLPERSDFCSNIIVSQMDYLAGRIFVDQTESYKIIDQVTEIKNYVRYIYTKMISESKWLSGQSKELVLKKMNSIKDKIGFADIILQDKFLDHFYKNFQIKSNFFENMEEVLVEDYRNILFKLIKPIKDEWLTRPGTVNAWHNLGTNSIEITLGILSDPFFELDYPKALNFGGIGNLIGHEYGHGFEVTGTKFDWNGEIKIYWSDPSFYNFGLRADCLVKQYSKYYLSEADLFVTNGNKTLNENICDLTGLQSAFYAYREWKRTNNVFPRVPQLPFSDEQLLFIGQARTWCDRSSPLFLRKFPYLDHHALNQLRVIGPLQNMPEFARTFNCPVGSFMNPSKKCSFW